MTTMMTQLKAEITRLARREIRKELTPVRRIHAAQRGLIAALRRQITDLQKSLKPVNKLVATTGVGGLAKARVTEDQAAGRFWITSKGVRSLRKRLGLTQIEMAKLAGVSGQTVVNWEGTQGKIPVRRKQTVAQLKAIRSLTRKSAAELLKKRPAAKSA